MKLTLVEHGGWGALLKRSPITLDTDTLPAGAADELRALAAVAERIPAGGDVRPTSRAPGAMTYEIQVEGEGRAATLKWSDVSAPPELVALQQAIRKHAADS